MASHLVELELTINHFLFQIMTITAQSSNKLKFHMLCYLPTSICRSGPASLFATERFEINNAII
ncbi:hypothetical protein CROQUDRAFT_45076 [Cronartium quercuum f. sp. fusiforme G11]|uniref:Uncharacterized protein n=1 Tax=Cronartium quercuum f. sp. fusiforme G11 TaxID=708437 RepID=A0A9P6NHY6_9BASI|nr:hypothetical protein CROQUDRAFT_45076 [Cronartium quercuum f. sp. fusiforme G11]